MKVRSLLLLLALLTLSLSLAAQQPSDKQIFKVTNHEITTEPISSLLYGNFIELGYGIQVESMWRAVA